MKELIRRGESGGQVSDWNPSSDTITAPSQTSFFAPHGLTLRQTITSSGAVTIPAGIGWVYVVLTGGGEGGYFGFGGTAGEVVWGWTLAQNTCIIGAGGGTEGSGGYSRYGHIIARGALSNTLMGTHYYGIPGGSNGTASAPNGTPGGFGGKGISTTNANGAAGGDGISGGGAGSSGATTGTSTGGTGGSGMAGGGGGESYASTGTRIGGTGGKGIGIDGTIYTGGIGFTTTAGNSRGGGGAGIAGNGANATDLLGGNGGLGGGGGGSGRSAGGGNAGSGGAGILYIWY